MAQITNFTMGNKSNNEPDIRTILQTSWECTKLPTDYRIPTKAWDLLTNEAREAFLVERNTAIWSTPKGDGTIPKQYEGAGHDKA